MDKVDTSKPYSSALEDWIGENPRPDYLRCSHEVTSQFVSQDSMLRDVFRVRCNACGAVVKTLKYTAVDRSAPVYKVNNAWEATWKRVKEDISHQNTERFMSWSKGKDAFFWDYYRSYMASARWQKLRLGVIAKLNNTCQCCGVWAISDVHHRHYRTLGEESTDDLAGLCENCHRAQHEHMWATRPTGDKA